MAFQAQVAQWAEQAVRAVIGPLFDRVDKIEKYILALENADVVPGKPSVVAGKPQTAVPRPAPDPVNQDTEEAPKSLRTTGQAPQARTGRPGGATRGK